MQQIAHWVVVNVQKCKQCIGVYETNESVSVRFFMCVCLLLCLLIAITVFVLNMCAIFFKWLKLEHF